MNSIFNMLLHLHFVSAESYIQSNYMRILQLLQLLYYYFHNMYKYGHKLYSLAKAATFFLLATCQSPVTRPPIPANPPAPSSNLRQSSCSLLQSTLFLLSPVNFRFNFLLLWEYHSDTILSFSSYEYLLKVSLSMQFY